MLTYPLRNEKTQYIHVATCGVIQVIKTISSIFINWLLLVLCNESFIFWFISVKAAGGRFSSNRGQTSLLVCVELPTSMFNWKF